MKEPNLVHGVKGTWRLMQSQYHIVIGKPGAAHGDWYRRSYFKLFTYCYSDSVSFCHQSFFGCCATWNSQHGCFHDNNINLALPSFTPEALVSEAWVTSESSYVCFLFCCSDRHRAVSRNGVPGFCHDIIPAICMFCKATHLLCG